MSVGNAEILRKGNFGHALSFGHRRILYALVKFHRIVSPISVAQEENILSRRGVGIENFIVLDIRFGIFVVRRVLSRSGGKIRQIQRFLSLHGKPFAVVIRDIHDKNQPRDIAAGGAGIGNSGVLQNIEIPRSARPGFRSENHARAPADFYFYRFCIRIINIHIQIVVSAQIGDIRRREQ